jgi:hypothetical protein
MKLIAFLFIVSGLAGTGAAVFYGATQVSPGTWDYAVIALATGLGVNLGSFGIARIVAARHRPADKNVTMIDKAIITSGELLPPTRH